MNQQAKYLSDVNIQHTRQEQNKSLKTRMIESDHKMIEQTIVLLSEGGVSTVTLDAVGTSAGYSRGQVSRRYGSKDGLLIRVLQLLDEWIEQHIADVTAERTGLDAINTLVLALAYHVNSDVERYRAYFRLWFYGPESHAGLKQSLRQIQQLVVQRNLKWLKQAQKAGQLSKHADLKMIADLIMAPVVGLIQQWLMDADFNIELRLKQLVKFQFRTIFSNSHLFHTVNYWGE